MLEPLGVTALALMFLTVLVRTEAKLRRRKVDMGGKAPIGHRIFALSKYAIVLVWLVTILRSWGIGLPTGLAQPWKGPALTLWVLGFTLLLAGRLGLGDSFRIGTPNEKTRLKTGGLFRFSRNPMYVGVYTTLAASVLYTMDPLVFAVAAFIIAVHHRIVLAEERTLRKAFGGEYARYCRRVRRYL
jgi:protein-S-isoprenylcysteine O-methyltransferase Ste14